jgi:hypothetical protein
MKPRTLITPAALTLSLLLNAGCTLSAAQPTSGTPSSPKMCEGGRVQTHASLAKYAGCTQITGSLKIEGTEASDLGALGSLRQVHGSLVIATNPKLESLEGLERLHSTHRLLVLRNEQLTSLAGLRSLSHVQEIAIVGNEKLPNLRGLEAVQRVRGMLLARNGLRTTRGLESLKETRELAIFENPRLISLGGLRNLKRAGHIRIEGNRSLAVNLGFLDGLEEVDGALHFSGSHGLRSHAAGLRERLGFAPKSYD